MTDFPIVADADADLSGFIASFASGTAALATFATAAVAATTAGIGLAALALIPAIEAATEFQDEIIKLNTLVGISTEQMNEFEEAILDLAPALGTTPQELARGMFAITSGGERSARAVDLLTQSAKAARLGLGDVTTIARVGTATLQAFADQGLTAAQAIDIMVGTVREGNLVAEELPNAFGRVIGIAGQMGVTFQEVGTFMATFTRLGVSAEIAGTSLRAMLFALLNPGKEARDTLDSLGLSVQGMRDAIANDGLTDAMLMLLKATNGNLDVLSDIIPNIRAMSGVLGVYAAQAEQVVEIQNNMNNIFGVTNEGFETIQGTLSQSFAELWASFKTGITIIGRSFIPATKLVIDTLNVLVDWASIAAEAILVLSSVVGRDLAEAFTGSQRDLTALRENLQGFSEDAESASLAILERTLEEVRIAKETVGARQKGDIGDARENNNRMNQLIGKERILNELIERRTNELRPKEIDGIVVVIGQTMAQEEAVSDLILKLENKLLVEQGLERQILETTLAENQATEAQRNRALAAFDATEAEKELNEAAKERIKTIARLDAAVERAAEKQERDVQRLRDRLARDKREERERIADVGIDIMISRIEQAMKKQREIMDDVTNSISNSFEDIIRGTKEVSEAFGDMITNIIAEFARLQLERTLTGLLSGLFFPIPDTPGVFNPIPTGFDPTAGLGDFSSDPSFNIAGANAQSQQPTTIVQQTINFSPSLIDGADGARWLQSQRGTITSVVADGVRRSTSLAATIRGRR